MFYLPPLPLTPQTGCRIKITWSQALVAHTCSPSYSGGRDQEDRNSKPAQAKVLRPYIKKKSQKRVGGVA
jgi:hypothetical protein